MKRINIHDLKEPVLTFGGKPLLYICTHVHCATSVHRNIGIIATTQNTLTLKTP